MNKLSASAFGIVAVVMASSTGCAAEAPAENYASDSSALTNAALVDGISVSPAIGQVIAASYQTTTTGSRNDVMLAMNNLRAVAPALASYDPADARDIVSAGAGKALSSSPSSADSAGDSSRASACVRSCRGQWYSAAAACGFFAPTLVGAAVCAATAMTGLHYCKVGCSEGRTFSPDFNPIVLNGIDPQSLQLDPEERQFFDVLLAPPPPPPETCTYRDVTDAIQWCPNGFRGCAIGYECTN